ncbi:MAG: PadR family transcriptional regulator [Pseudomonadota bacterium]
MDVKVLCLGVLSRADCSGYEIRKQFEEGPFCHFQDAGYGSIYPALRKLTEDGLIVGQQQAQDNRPDKKVYRITPKGRQALFDAINEPPPEDKMRSDFLFVMFFADLLEPRQLDSLIQQRIEYHREALERLSQKNPSNPGQRFVLNYGRLMHRSSLEYFENYQHELLGGVMQAAVAE